MLHTCSPRRLRPIYNVSSGAILGRVTAGSVAIVVEARVSEQGEHRTSMYLAVLLHAETASQDWNHEIIGTNLHRQELVQMFVRPCRK